jgi:hypothetical protein
MIISESHVILKNPTLKLVIPTLIQKIPRNHSAKGTAIKAAQKLV